MTRKQSILTLACLAIGIASPLAHSVEKSPTSQAGKAPGEPATDERLAVLEADLSAGRRSTNAVMRDKAFNGMRENPRFRELIRRFAGESESWLPPGDEPGERLLVSGCIRDRDGKPVAGAEVYVYHTDRMGVYSSTGGNATLGDSLNPRIFGYLRTDPDGRYRYHTIRPAGYPQNGPPAHVHYEIAAQGHRTRTTELMFSDDERMTPSSRKWAESEGFVICTPRRDDAGNLTCQADFVLDPG